MEQLSVFTQIRTLTAAAEQPSIASMVPMLLSMVLMFVVLYFFMIRPQNKKKKKEDEMKRNAQVGDEVTTIGGISGRIIAVKKESEKAGADSLILETGSDRTKIRVKRWAIGSVDTIREEDE